MGNSRYYRHASECAKFKKTTAECKFGDTMCSRHTQPNLVRDKSATIAIHITAKDERQMHITDSAVGRQDSHPSETPTSREQECSEKKESRDQHLESSKHDQEITEIQTLQHARTDPSNGFCAWKN